jgi:hypothetical protein
MYLTCLKGISHACECISRACERISHTYEMSLTCLRAHFTYLRNASHVPTNRQQLEGRSRSPETLHVFRVYVKTAHLGRICYTPSPPSSPSNCCLPTSVSHILTKCLSRTYERISHACEYISRAYERISHTYEMSLTYIRAHLTYL